MLTKKRTGNYPSDIGQIRAKPALAGAAARRLAARAWHRACPAVRAVMVLAPLGGVLADRIDKRRALMVTQVAAMVQAIVLFGLTITGAVEIWHVMVLAGVLGVISAVDMPVRQSFAAELVPPRDLVNAIALNSASCNAARVVGPAVAWRGACTLRPRLQLRLQRGEPPRRARRAGG